MLNFFSPQNYIFFFLFPKKFFNILFFFIFALKLFNKQLYTYYYYEQVT